LSGIGPSELIVLVVVGLLILGPERLPRVATQIGRWVGRARRTANQLRYQLEREITLADIEGKKKKEQDAQAKRAADQAKPSDTGDSDADNDSPLSDSGLPSNATSNAPSNAPSNATSNATANPSPDPNPNPKPNPNPNPNPNPEAEGSSSDGANKV
jgi:sec-independent protein translocase protein TatB